MISNVMFRSDEDEKIFLFVYSVFINTASLSRDEQESLMRLHLFEE